MKGHYAYLNARVKAKSSLLFKHDDYLKLIQMGFSDIAKYIGDMQYKSEIDGLAAKYSGAELIERALSQNLANVMDALIRMSNGRTKDVLRSYLSFWSVENIKTLLRAKYAQLSPDEISSSLLPVQNYAQLNALAAEPSVEDVIGKLGESYQKLLEEPLAHYRTTKNLMFIENALDKYALSNMIQSSSIVRERRVVEHIKARIDLTNLKTLIRLKKAGADDIERFIIPGGKETMARLINAPLDELANLVETPAYRDALKEYSKEGMVALENALELAYVKHALRLSREFPLSLAPVIGFIIQKENEVKNLRSIVRGKEKEFSPNEIQKLIVI